MHGADGKSAELRPASIKGILRFWWRAIHGNLSLKDLHEQEGEIFGSTKERSKVNLRIANNKETKKSFQSLTTEIKDNIGIKYNFYPIFMNNDGKSYFDSLTFELILSGNDKKALEEAINALIYLNFFGGLGSRSRRGAGSIKITLKENKEKLFEDKLKLLKTDNITTKEAFQSHLVEILNKVKPHSSPKYTTFYKHLYMFKPQKDWKSALELIAKPFQVFRNDKQSDVLETPNFGFPIVHKDGGGTFIGGEIKNNKVINPVERRASPLMFKIFMTSKGHYFPLLLWMDGNLLPNENQVILKKGGDTSQNKKPNDELINEFIKELEKKDHLKVVKNGN
jgi:CRISPR-associated protein Cmr1